MITDLPDPTIITTDAALAAHADAWATAPLLAVDTESNSLHAYREQVCLIQLSTREQDYIIDPLQIEDLSPLGDLFADPAIEIVFHAAEYDLMCLKRDFGFTFTNLFDTMIAARICGSNTLGLANMLQAYFGVKVNKKHQRANWGARPLPPEMLRYAQMDTHYLPRLRDIWQENLQEAAHWPEAQEMFAELQDIPAAEHHFDPDGFWRINGTRHLNPRQMSVLRALYLFREEMAERRDSPPFKVMGDKTLLALATATPANKDDLRGIIGMTSGQIRRYGRGILDAVRRGRKADPPRRPSPPPRPDDIVLARFDALRSWRKHRAGARGVESDVIVSKDVLWAVARNAPADHDALAAVSGLGPWKLDAYGDELLDVIAQVDDRSNGHRRKSGR